MPVYNRPMSLLKNWTVFRDDLARAVQRYGRGPERIKVMAVSKTRGVDEIRQARGAGLSLFGENRVDEALSKFEGLPPADYPLCLIGRLQSNKAARISSRFAAVHSVDSIRIAQKLSKVREQINAPLEVLIQVNTSGEESKSGFRDRLEFQDAAAQIAAMPAIVFKGVMTMAPFVDNEALVRRCFAQCRQWLEAVQSLTVGPPVLSMGMSSDYQWAVAEGSTMLRIGTSLFGSRE